MIDNDKISGVKLKSYLIQTLASSACCLSFMIAGVIDAWSSPSILKLEQLPSTAALHASSEQGSYLTITPILTAACIGMFSGRIIDKIGRRRTIIFISIPIFASWLLIAFAQNHVYLFVGRALAGVFDAFTSITSSIYVSEIADARIRGILGTLPTVFWIIGIFLMNIIGLYCTIQNAALIMLGLSSLGVFMTFWMPESPYFYIIKGNLEGARSSLKVLRCKDNVDEELERIGSAVKVQMENTHRFIDLFTDAHNRRAILVMMILRAFQQFTGGIAIIFYTQTIIESLNVSLEMLVTVYSTIQLTFTLLSWTIIDRFGRRPLLLISLTASGVSLATIGTYLFIKETTTLLPADESSNNFVYIPAVALLTYVGLFNLGMQPIPVLMVGEIFPANVKAYAVSYSYVFFCCIVVLVSKSFQMSKDKFGMYFPFYGFTAACIIGLVLVAIFVPETKGKTLEEIQQEFRGKVVRKEEKN